MLLCELCKIMANAASDVDDKSSIVFGFGALDQPLSNRIEVCVHPAWPSLTVATHVVVELGSEWRICLQIRKKVELGVVCVLVRAVLRITWLTITSLCGEEVEIRKRGVSATSSRAWSAIFLLVTKRQLTSRDNRRR